MGKGLNILKGEGWGKIKCEIKRGTQKGGGDSHRGNYKGTVTSWGYVKKGPEKLQICMKQEEKPTQIQTTKKSCINLSSLEAEFNEFEQRLKSHKNRFQLCAGVKSCKMEYSLKWSQPYLSRGSNSLNSASGLF